MSPILSFQRAITIKKLSERFSVLLHTKSGKSGVYFPLTAIYTIRSHHLPSAHCQVASVLDAAGLERKLRGLNFGNKLFAENRN